MQKFTLLMINFIIFLSCNTCLAIDNIPNAIEAQIKERDEKSIERLSITKANTQKKKGITYIGFSICSDASDDFSTGKSDIQENFGHHAWLAITNFGSIPIDINGVEIPVFGTITIGTWQGGIHNGIFYNVEGYYAQKGEFSKTESAYKMILLNDFKLNYMISLLAESSNDAWSVTNNCASFAERIWNELSDTKISAGIIKCPLKLYENILILDGKKGVIISLTDLELYYGGKNPIKFEL